MLNYWPASHKYSVRSGSSETVDSECHHHQGFSQQENPECLGLIDYIHKEIGESVPGLEREICPRTEEQNTVWCSEA